MSKIYDVDSRGCHKQGLYKNDSIRVEALGLFCGLFYEGKECSPEEAGDLISFTLETNDHNELRRLIRHVVGPCHILIANEKSVELWSSPSSSRFLYGTTKKKHNEVYTLCSNLEGGFTMNGVQGCRM